MPPTTAPDSPNPDAAPPAAAVLAETAAIDP